MTGYLIKLVAKPDNSRHTKFRMFVARPGSEHSYTDKPEHAKVFATRDEAARECCENERILTIEEAFG